MSERGRGRDRPTHSNKGGNRGNYEREAHPSYSPHPHNSQPHPPLLSYPGQAPPGYPPQAPPGYSPLQYPGQKAQTVPVYVPQPLQYPQPVPAPYHVTVTVNHGDGRPDPRESRPDPRESYPHDRYQQPHDPYYQREPQPSHHYDRREHPPTHYTARQYESPQAHEREYLLPSHQQPHRNNDSPQPPPYTRQRHEPRQGGGRRNQGDVSRDPYPSEPPPPYDSIAPPQRGGRQAHRGNNPDRYAGERGRNIVSETEGYTPRSRHPSTGSNASVDSRSSNQHYTKHNEKTNRPRTSNLEGYTDRPKASQYTHGNNKDSPVGQFPSRARGKKTPSHGHSMENLMNVKVNVQETHLSSQESNTSGGSQSHNRGRGRGRWQRGRGGNLGRSHKNQNFKSMPDLVSPDGGESKPRKPFPRKRPNRGTTVQMHGEMDEPVAVPSVRTTKAALQILQSFASADQLKATVRQSHQESDDVDLRIVDESIICSERRGLCTILLETDSKQQAKRVVKNLCQNMRKTLRVNVTYEISSTEEEKEIRKEIQQVVKVTNQSRRQQVDHILSYAGQNADQNQEKPRKNMPVKEMSPKDDISDKIQEAKENVTVSKEKKTPLEKDPIPVPTRISVTVGKSFSDKQKITEFMTSLIDEKTSTFEIMPDSVAISSSKTLFDLMVPSKAAAGRLVKKLNTFKLDEITVRAHVVGDTTVRASSPSAEEVKSAVQVTLEEVERMVSIALGKHSSKIERHEEALDVMQLSAKDGEDYEDDADAGEELALRDKLMEVIKVKEEFNQCVELLMEKVRRMEGQNISGKDLKEISQSVGVECNRLATALPVYAKRKEFIKMISNNKISVVVGEPGSGKSTQLAQYIYEAGLSGDGMIVCTQPRKVAAVRLAEFVSKELGKKVGSLVGYRVGTKSIESETTKIIYSTDHCLLNECLKDPNLSSYSCIIVDEAHERSIYTDLLLGMIKASLARRPDLKVIITSATRDPAIFIKYFNSGPELRVSGRTFPVDVVYEDMDSTTEFEDYETKAVAKTVSVHRTEGQGDILVFLTSPVEIMRCCKEFDNQMGSRSNYKCYPFHDQMTYDEQRKVFEKLPEGIRKIVFATNCAETSITIDGIKFVIDTGVAKEMRYDAKKNISLLGTHVISQSSADQRKGRSGRTSSGKCFRLYSESGYKSMSPTSQPEIQKTDLGNAIIKLFQLGFDCTTFGYLESPRKEAVVSALHTLREFQAVSNDTVTEVGSWISLLPCDYRLGYLIYKGLKENMLYDAIVLAALISNGTEIFFKEMATSGEERSALHEGQYDSEYGDVFTWLEVYKVWLNLPKPEQAKWCQSNNINYKALSFTRHFVTEVCAVLNKNMESKIELNFSNNDCAPIILRKLIFDAYMSSLCQYQDHLNCYFDTIADQQVHVNSSSSLVRRTSQPEWIVYTELTKTAKYFIKGICVVEKEWVQEAIQRGRLDINMEKSKAWRIQLVHREEVGSFVFKHLVGARYTNLQSLEKSLSDAGMKNVVVEADRDLGVLDVYSSSPMNQDAAKSMSTSRTGLAEYLQDSEAEIPLIKNFSGKDVSGIRILMGRGGSVKMVLMPHQSNKILIKNAKPQTPEEDIVAKFKAYGIIKECVQYRDSDVWGCIRYESCIEADRAVRATERDRTNVAVLKIDNKTKRIRSKFEAKVVWCRRPVKTPGIAYIKCPPVERGLLLGKKVKLPGGLLEIVSSKNDLELVCQNIGDSKEADIKRALVSLLGYDEKAENNIHVTIAREWAKPLSKEAANQIKAELYSEFEKFMPNDKFNLTLISPKDNSVYQVGHIHFDNPVAGFNACKMADGQIFIGGQLVEISPQLKTTVHVPASIMEVCRSRFDEIIKGLAEYKHVEVSFRTMKQGDCAIDMKSAQAEQLLEAKSLFQKELEGEIIDCSGNTFLKSLLKYSGKKLLSEIEHAQSVLILVDERKEKVHTYGSVQNVNKAQIEINRYLGSLQGIKSVELSLMKEGQAQVLMRDLMVKYGTLPEGIINKFGLNDVSIDLKRQRIVISGPGDAVDRAMASIADLENGPHRGAVIEPDRWIPHCVVCRCPVEDVQQLYRLESCGHCYCHPCLQVLVSVLVKEKFFPVTCAQENCALALAWKDFELFLHHGWISERELVVSALDVFMARNSMYKFCLTPNCPVVYEVTEDREGCELNCPVCSVSLCTSCHTVFHAGMECKPY